MEVLGNETRIYKELVGNENDVFEILEGKPVDEVDDGNNILGCKGYLGIKGSIDWMVVEIIDDVVVSKWGIEGLDVYANNWANSIASSISLRIVAFISSSLSWFLTFFNSKSTAIFFCCLKKWNENRVYNNSF